MADKDFVVKNGLVANTDISVGNSINVGNTINIGVGPAATVNSSLYTGSANNASYLGTIAAASYVQNTESRTLSGNLYFTGANNVFSTKMLIGANLIANTTAWFVGDGTANAYLTSAGLFVNGAPFTSGGGYYKGNAGVLGSPSNANSLFRINANTMTADITISPGENAQVTGPLEIQSGKTLTIQTGARVSIT